MDLTPFEPSDEFGEMLEGMQKFPLSFVMINNPGEYENENIIFVANEDIESLYDFILAYEVEDEETGLPVYEKCRFLTFDSIELNKGDYVQIFTQKGDDTNAIDFDSGALHTRVFWGLSKAIWNEPHCSFVIMRRGDSYGGMQEFD